MARLSAVPESKRWLNVSIQALHRFYERRTERVVASWMTRQDRESAIADNIAYAATCIDKVASEWPTIPLIVFAGFSQGVAMAYRAAANETRAVAGVVAVGGDIPPELTPASLQRVTAAIMARGTADSWYTQEKLADDERRLKQCSVSFRSLEFNGGHEWSPEVAAAVSQFLRERYP
jgi:predicted esterase